MHLIIGGAFQGKSAYVRHYFHLAEEEIIRGETATIHEIQSAKAVTDFHLWIKAMMAQGQDPLIATYQILEKQPELIIITDEIGCGIVPLQAFEREWREMTGRVCCFLAQEATTVTRIVGGLPIKIKEAD